MRVPGRLKAVIFDVDGTLADTEDAHRCAFNSAFEEQGLDWNWTRPRYAELLATTGGKERLAVHVDSLALEPAECARLKARIPAIHATKTELYTRMIDDGRVALRDGVARLIDEALDAGVRLAIATTTTYANIEALLRVNLGAAALARFAVIGAADQVRRKKPAPDIYAYVLHELALSSSDCVAIEDSFNGLIAAKGAGLYTVVTPSYWTRDEDFSAADLVLPTLGSEARPLAPAAAALVGHFQLGIRELERLMTDNNEVRPAHPLQEAAGGP
jgi:HAD superfamily hydrolase (TIGR01509 family)